MTIAQLQSNLKNYKLGYNTTTEFIMENYKSSTLPRMFYDYKMTVAQIDSNKKIREHILNEGMNCGFTQDDLFEAMSN
jgi:predicted patatin/cPLA2 family phospholipase